MAFAMQGVTEEMRSFKYCLEDDTLLRDLASNAFIANIIAAFMIAGVLVM